MIASKEIKEIVGKAFTNCTASSFFSLGIWNEVIYVEETSSKSSGNPIAKKLLRDVANDPFKKNNCIAIARNLDIEFKKLKQEYKK